jgi:hypothetical protein
LEEDPLMFFILSKTTAFFLLPSNFLITLVFIGLLHGNAFQARWPVAGRGKFYSTGGRRLFAGRKIAAPCAGDPFSSVGFVARPTRRHCGVGRS